MYVYFNQNGVLKELVNEPTRQGSVGVKDIYFYWDGEHTAISFISATYKLPSGAIVYQNDISTTTVDEHIPFNKNRDLKYFEYYKDYPFYKFIVPNDALVEDGLVSVSITVTGGDVLPVMGKITFNVEESNIKPDGITTGSQFQYLLSLLGALNGIATLDNNGQVKLSQLVNMQGKLTSENAGSNITITFVDGVLKINSTGGGTTDYNDLDNKPKINNVELSGNKTTSDLNISYNDLTNKPTIPSIDGLEHTSNKKTTINAQSTDDEYPSAKCVYDNIEDVRAVATGKCKVYVIAYTDTYNESYVGRYIDKDGNTLTQAQIEAFIENKELKNTNFNSQNDYIGLPNYSGYYFILRKGLQFILIASDDWSDLFKQGDEVFVIETDVPDRWFNNGYLYALETKSTQYSAGWGITLIQGNISVNNTQVASQTNLQQGLATRQPLGDYATLVNNKVPVANMPYTSGVGIQITNDVISNDGVNYQTDAPTASNPNGLKVVVLDSEPSTKYTGYIYMIKESA